MDFFDKPIRREQLDFEKNFKQYYKQIKSKEHFEKNIISNFYDSNKKYTLIHVDEPIALNKGFGLNAELYKITYYYKKNKKSKKINTIWKMYFSPYENQSCSPELSKYKINVPLDSYEVGVGLSIGNAFKNSFAEGFIPKIYYFEPRLHCFEMEYINCQTLEEWLYSHTKQIITDILHYFFGAKEIGWDEEDNLFLTIDANNPSIIKNFDLNEEICLELDKIWNHRIMEIYNEIVNNHLNFLLLLNKYNSIIKSTYLNYYEDKKGEIIKQQINIPLLDKNFFRKKLNNEIIPYWKKTVNAIPEYQRMTNITFGRNFNPDIDKFENEFIEKQCHLIHGDIHPNNIFITSVKDSRFARFDNSLILNKKETQISKVMCIFCDLKHIKYSPTRVDTNALNVIFNSWEEFTVIKIISILLNLKENKNYILNTNNRSIIFSKNKELTNKHVFANWDWKFFYIMKNYWQDYPHELFQKTFKLYDIR